MVFCNGNQFMDSGFASSNSIKRNVVFRQIDLRANQFVSTSTLYPPPVSHRFHVLRIRRSANENHLALRLPRIIQRPVLRNLPTSRRGFMAIPIFVAHRFDVHDRLALNVAQVFKTKTFPYATFPSSVVVFNRRLEAGFSRRHEHGDHVQAQTTTNHLSQAVRPPTSLKHRRIVELRIIRKSEFVPEFNHLLYRVFRGHPDHRPRTDQSAVQRNSVQYLKRFSSFDAQVFDVIELIEFGEFPCKRFQVPSGRRCFVTFSLSSVEFSFSFQDSVNGCSRWWRGTSSLFHFFEDGIGSVLSEWAVFFELFSEIQDTLFDLFFGAVDRVCRLVWLVVPINAVKSFSFGMIVPSFDGCFTDSKFLCHGSDRLAVPDGLNYLSPIRCRQATVFALYSFYPSKNVHRNTSILTNCPTSC